jgi:hypothetical protein
MQVVFLVALIAAFLIIAGVAGRVVRRLARREP